MIDVLVELKGCFYLFNETYGLWP